MFVTTLNRNKSGGNFGKFKALDHFMKNSFILNILILLAAGCPGRTQNTFRCDNLIRIDSFSFEQHKIKAEVFDSVTTFKKLNNQIRFPNQKKIFKDDLSNENYMEYTLAGEIKNRNWVLVKGQDYNQNHYFIYNKTANTIDTVVGNPRIFNNKILSTEEPYTDYPGIVEIWDIDKNNNITLNKKFPIRNCTDFSLLESYLSKGYLFIRSGVEQGKSDYFKVKLESAFESGQTTQIDTLFLPRKEKFSTIQSEKLKFPIIKTGNQKVDSLINFDLKNRFTNNEYIALSTKEALLEFAGDQMVYLGFEVTYNQDGMLSLNISAEGCGAYCTSWTGYYNYSTQTGKFLTLEDIIDTSSKFKTKVLADKDKQYELQRQELKEMLLDKTADLNRETYDWALEEYNNCDNAFELKTFALHKEYLEIIAQCYLPHAIRNLTPIIELKYNYTDIKRHLKIKK